MVSKNVRFPTRLWEDAQTTADRNDETVSEVIRRSLTDYVEKNR